MGHTDIATRAVIVALKSPFCGKTNAEVAAITGVSVRAVTAIYSRAIKAGFDPNVRPLVIKNEWLADKPRSGRPPKSGKEEEPTQLGTEEEKVSLEDSYDREKSAGEIADESS